MLLNAKDAREKVQKAQAEKDAADAAEYAKHRAEQQARREKWNANVEAWVQKHWMPEIEKAVALRQYECVVCFDDGVEGDVDVAVGFLRSHGFVVVRGSHVPLEEHYDAPDYGGFTQYTVLWKDIR